MSTTPRTTPSSAPSGNRSLRRATPRSSATPPPTSSDSRSWMNVTFRLPSEELEKRFVQEATAAGFDGLKGHRSVGGLRASIYNAFPEGGIDALLDFMREFERRNG